MQLDHKLHVLALGIVIVPSGRDHGILLEQAEGAGNDEVTAEAVEQKPGSQKGS